MNKEILFEENKIFLDQLSEFGSFPTALLMSPVELRLVTDLKFGSNRTQYLTAVRPPLKVTSLRPKRP